MQTTGKKKCPVCAKSMAELLSMWKLSARLISGQHSSECFLWRKGCTLVFTVLTALTDCGIWIIVSHRDNAETQTQRSKEELDMLIDLWQDPTLKALAQAWVGDIHLRWQVNVDISDLQIPFWISLEFSQMWATTLEKAETVYIKTDDEPK